MKLIKSRVERSEQILTPYVSTGVDERSRNVDVLTSLVLRLQDLDIHSVFPLTSSRCFFGRTKIYNGHPSPAEIRTTPHRGSVCR